MPESVEICPRCQQPRKPAVSGSLTQWITVCRCDQLDEESKQSTSLSVCVACGKRVAGGRSGSFTQWIFRADLCKCEHPVISDVREAPGALGERPEIAETEPNMPDEEYLDLSEADFPTNRYRPLQELGAGSTGSVYLCRDAILNKKVAVKTLRTLSSETLVSLQEEARATSRLKHDNIVEVLDLGATESGVPFMVMEYVQGVSLDDHLKERGSLPEPEARIILIDICRALARAHEQGIYHRDIKPGNMLVRHEGGHPSVKLIDFGLAHILDDDQEPTIFQGREIAGTPAYMSPDQVVSGDYDARSEIYSVGCVVFEMITGHPPFESATALDTLYKHANQAPPTLAAAGANVSDELEKIVARCLAKNPKERFESVLELLGAVSHEPLEPSLADPEQVKKTDVSGRLLALVSVVTVVVFAALLINGFKSSAGKNPQDESRAEKKNSTRSIARNQDQVDVHKLDLTLSDFPDSSNLAFARPDTLIFKGKSAAAELREAVWKNENTIENVLIIDGALTDSDVEVIKTLNPMVVTVSGSPNLTDRSLEILSSIDILDRLAIEDAHQITSKGILQLKKNTRLAYISFRNCNLQNEDMKAIAQLKHVAKLNLSNNRDLTLKGLEYLAEAKQPIIVVVEGCQCAMIPTVTKNYFRQKHRLEIQTSDDDSFDEIFGGLGL